MMKRKFAITDCRIPPEMERRLRLLGFDILTLPPSPTLPEAVASHTDMLLLPLGDEYISVADYCEVAPHIFTDLCLMLSGRAKLYFTSDKLGCEYPEDAKLNALRIGDRLFIKSDTASPYVIEKARSMGLKIVPIKQGYPACTTLKLTDSAAITADCGMKRALETEGIRVTLIENGDILLPPYEYGFIGGCAGVFENKIYFLGDPKTHRSYPDILSACEGEGLEVVSLGDGPLVDLGGIILSEYDLK